MKKVLELLSPKRRGLLLAHCTSTAYNEPLTPNLILIYSIYTDLRSSWHSNCPLTLAFAHYRSWTYNTQQHDRPHNTSAPTSLIHTQMPAKDTFILHYRLCTLRKHKLSFFQISWDSRSSINVQPLSSLSNFSAAATAWLNYQAERKSQAFS
jgi:hypothetical protein